MANKKSDGPSSVADVPAASGAAAALLAITPEERYLRIAEAAYLRAAARQFVCGDPVQDWLEAELEVDTAVEHTQPEAT